MFQIKTAKNDDFGSVREFYYSLIDAMQNADYKPAWEKDVYPSQQFLIQSIEGNELYIGELDGQIAACMVVNQKYNAEYKTVQWSVAAADSELLVIHALGVHPKFAGRGVATQMIQKVIAVARDNHMRTIRLDVLEGNLPAEKTYAKQGFSYLDTIQMFYEDTGWTNFKLFEYII